jgi:biotin synthase
MQAPADAHAAVTGPDGASGPIRHDWRAEEALALMAQPFGDLLHQAHSVHRRHFDPNRVEIATLLSIKTGGCPEDCKYCPQSAHYDTGLGRGPLMALAPVVAAACRAKSSGATRFCMGAAWRSPTDRDLARVCDMVAAVKAEGLETCATLGMLTAAQARALADSGLDFYNHNVDTSEEFYGEIVSTRPYGDRIATLGHVRDAGLRICCGGIVGMGESRADRAAMLAALANLPQHPESVPINMLIRVAGTPLADAPPVDPFELVRTVACARILMPRSVVRLSAGREAMSDELQALAFHAGANSIFHGDVLLTARNAAAESDRRLFARLGIQGLGPGGT